MRAQTDSMVPETMAPLRGRYHAHQNCLFTQQILNEMPCAGDVMTWVAGNMVCAVILSPAFSGVSIMRSKTKRKRSSKAQSMRSSRLDYLV